MSVTKLSLKILIIGLTLIAVFIVWPLLSWLVFENSFFLNALPYIMGFAVLMISGSCITLVPMFFENLPDGIYKIKY